MADKLLQLTYHGRLRNVNRLRRLPRLSHPALYAFASAVEEEVWRKKDPGMFRISFDCIETTRERLYDAIADTMDTFNYHSGLNDAVSKSASTIALHSTRLFILFGYSRYRPRRVSTGVHEILSMLMNRGIHVRYLQLTWRY